MAISPCNSTADASGMEQLAHGTRDFPIACYHDDLSKETVPWHWHEELEFAIVSEGSIYCRVENEEFEVKCGEGVFVNSGVMHTMWKKGNSNESCRLHSMCFHGTLVTGDENSVLWKKYLQPFMETGPGYLVLKPEIDWQKKALDEVETAWQSVRTEPQGHEFIVRDRISYLCRKLILNANESAPGSSLPTVRRENGRDNRIKLMMLYVQRNYGNKITLEEIANAASVSVSEALRCFKGTIGTTPIAYLKKYRLNQAAWQLEHTELPVLEIAYRCGFQGGSYFDKLFSEEYGETPTAYRKKKAG